jgi:hypothetical protein
MSSSGLARLGGLAAVMADLLLLTTDIIDVYNIDAYRTAELNREYLTTGTHAFQSALRLVAFGLLLPLGLVGLYARQSDATGPLGLVSGFVWVDTFLALELATSAPRFIEAGAPPGRSLSFAVFGVGWVLFGLASLVGRVYPKSAAALLIVGAVIGTVVSLTLLPLPLGGLPFFAAVAWLGITLFAGWGTSGSG